MDLGLPVFCRFDFSECHGGCFFKFLNTSPMAMLYSRFVFVKRTMHHFKDSDIFQIWAPKLRTHIFIFAFPLGSCLSGFDVGHSCFKMPGPVQAY